MAVNWEPRVDEVVALIQAAFANVPMPPQADLRLGPVPESSQWPAWLVPGAAAAFQLPRTQVEAQQYGHASVVFHLLPLAGQRYHLPGLLLAGLRGQHVLTALEPEMPISAERGGDPRCEAILARLNPEQCHALGEFLSLVLEAVQTPRSLGACTNPFFEVHSRLVSLPEAVLLLDVAWPGCGHKAVEAARALNTAPEQGAVVPQVLAGHSLDLRPEHSAAVTDALAPRIAAAFADLTIPQTDTPFAERPDFDDDRDMPRVTARWQRTVAGKPWTDVPDRDYAGYAYQFGLLQPEVWRYYLPGMLMSVARSLAGTDGLGPRDYYLARLGTDPLFERNKALLSPSQRLAVCDVLGLYLPERARDDSDFESWGEVRRIEWEAAQPLRRGWHDVDHPAVHRALAQYQQWHSFEWPEAQDAALRSLLTTIRTAFTPRPQPGTVCEITSFSPDEISFELEFRGVDWRTLHPQVLTNCYEALSFFTPEAFAYFLPAYLTAELMGVYSNANPCFDLTHGFYERDGAADGLLVAGSEERIDWRAYNAAKCESLNAAERQAIVAYLRYVAEQDEFERDRIGQALESYWLPSIAALQGPGS